MRRFFSAEKCLKEEHASEMDFTGKALKGMVYVNPDGIRTKSQLKRWIGICLDRATGDQLQQVGTRHGQPTSSALDRPDQAKVPRDVWAPSPDWSRFKRRGIL